MKIYVDVDGTLVNAELDNKFKMSINEIGFEETMKWYDECNVDNLSINMDLVNELIKLKEEGNELILWTNRGSKQVEMTKRNLGIYWYMFSSYEFHSGSKGKCVLDGMVYDNEEKYLSCGTSSKLIKY